MKKIVRICRPESEPPGQIRFFDITELTDMRKSNMIWQAGSLDAYIYYNQFFNEVIERITSPFNDCFFC